MPAFLIRQKSEIFATFSPGEGLRGNFGLRETVKVGDTDLATYYYTDDRNNYLEALDYGNDGIVNYTYDDKGRLLTQTYEDGDTLTHTYDNSGNLATVTDSATGRKTTYYYDLTDRLMKTVETGENYLHSVEYTYDAENNLTQQIENINGVIRTVSYSYDKDNRVTDVSDGTVSVHYTYDGYGRVFKKETKNGGTVIKTESYTFEDLEHNPKYTSDQVATYSITVNGQTTTYSYTYDKNGNITEIMTNSSVHIYTYDSANQLVREEGGSSEAIVHNWAYDDAGNILSQSLYKEGAEDLIHIKTIDYTYGNSQWGDYEK